MKTATQTNALQKIMCILASVLLLALMVPSMAFADDTGSITLDNPQDGQTYTAYKIFDVSYNDDKTAYSYTIDSSSPWFETVNKYTGLTLEQINGGTTYNVVKNDGYSAAAFAQALKEANVEDTAGHALSLNGGSASVSGLPLGYYFVTTTSGALCNLTTTTPTAAIHDKNDKPSVDKKIVEGDMKVDANNVAIGDVVNYEVTSSVPDMTGYEKYYFVVTDTMSKGLSFNNDIAIRVGNTNLVKDTDFTVTTNEGKNDSTTIEIVFKGFYNKFKDQANAPIVINYSATLNKDAVVGDQGNPNTASLKYSNNPAVKDDGTPDNPDKPTDKSPTGTTPGHTTQTYVTGIQLNKVDPSGAVLTGAEFKITGDKLNTVLISEEKFVENENGKYWKLKDGSYTIDDPTAEGMDQSKYDSTTTKYAAKTVDKTVTKSEKVTYSGTVNEQGILTFKGLSKGNYEITEITAPEGYNLLSQPIELTIGWTAPTDSSDCTWTYEWMQGDKSLTPVGNAQNTIQIENNTGSQLPSTGGIGTTIFYVGGAILIIGAIAALIIKRRNAHHSE